MVGYCQRAEEKDKIEKKTNEKLAWAQMKKGFMHVGPFPEF